MRIVRIDIIGPQPLLFGTVDEPLDIARGKFVIINTGRLEQALDGRQLVGRIKNLEGLGQTCIAVVCTQQAVAQAMKRTHPHATRIDGQQCRKAREHLTRRLVGKRYCQQAKGANLPPLNQPRHARGQNPGFTASRPGQHQGMASGECNGSLLLRVKRPDHAA